jgi:hypothetical protein
LAAPLVAGATCASAGSADSNKAPISTTDRDPETRLNNVKDVDRTAVV